ncbi:DUF7426 family protein [Sphaerisporangium sp. NPDC004334]
MAFKDLDEFFVDTLPLPVGGKTYVVPPADAETGLLCQRLMAAGIDAANGKQVDLASLDDAGEKDLYRRCLGAVYDELIADGVTWPKVKHCGVTAFLWIAGDVDTAETYWLSGGDDDPETPAPNRAARRAAASTTRKRGSTSTTNPAPRPLRTRTAKASPGQTS